MREFTFGIVGGHGATGRNVVSELVRPCPGQVLAGGRDLSRLDSLAAESGNRVSAARLDVLDASSLDEFCRRCAIVINCAGPVMLLQDRVAQAAFRERCHYVDLADMSVVRERMLPHSQAIADLGLSFVISAGWTPGITELLPVYAHAQAKLRMESIEAVKVYFSDSGEWSDSALRDGAWYLRRIGLTKPGRFRKGEWVRATLSEASNKVDLGGPIGLRRFSLYVMPELMEAGRSLGDCDVFTYAYLAGFRNAAAAMMIALLPLPETLAVRLLRGIFQRNRLPVGGFVEVHVSGRSEGRPATLKSRIVFEPGQDYRINSVVPTTVARMIAAGEGVRAGVRFLFDAVDPISFMSELRRAGVRQTESFEP